MATESPMRMVEGGGARNWPSSKDSTIFGTGLKNMAAEELGFLRNGQRFHGDQTDMIPSRSGSAPPSMEGSFAGIMNNLAQQNYGTNSSLESLSNALGNYESEEQLRSHPAYLAYYCSNVNLNPRLPPPLISRENQRLLCHMSSSGNNCRSNSMDTIGNGSLHLFQNSLSTHEEEPEGDRSSSHDSENLSKFSSAILSGQNTLVGWHKNLVDLIQEDFPRTPSPVYNLSRSCHATAEEPIDVDVHDVSLDVSSKNISEGSSNGSANVRVPCNMSSHDIALISDNDPAAVSFSSSLYIHGTGTSLNLQIDDRNSRNTGLEDDASVSDVPQSDVSQVKSRMGKKQEEQPYQGRMMLLQYPYGQQVFPYPVNGRTASLEMNHAHNCTDSNSYGHAKFSSFEVRPPMHSPALTPPLYAKAAAHLPSGNSFYPSFQPCGPGAYPLQYNLNSALHPPFVAGYPLHGLIPLPFDATSGSNFNIQATSISHVGSLQHQKFYGQQGLMLQSPFSDPLRMHYFQQPPGNPYNASVQHAQLASSVVNGVQVDPSTKKEPVVASHISDENLHSSINRGPRISVPRKAGVHVGSYRGGPPGMGVMAQFPRLSIASPVLPLIPVSSTSQLVRQGEMRLPQGLNRNTGMYAGWQGQGIFVDSKKPSFLEELKSSNGQKFELSDIAARIVEFSVDQHGSRFIQQKLEHYSLEEKASIFKVVLPHCSKLMTDVFGNYVIQKFFEHGSPEQRKELAEKLVGQMLPLSLQMYGCRVIQKALEVVELDQKIQLVCELDGHVERCVHDQNGNHVIQKCVECVPAEKIAFIISAFQGQVASLSSHPYGCRVIQRILEHCSDEEQVQCIVDEIMGSACAMAHDQYGNYVTQHVLVRGKPHERSLIFSKLSGKIVQMSQHKYASNVVEKCLEYGNPVQREHLIEEILRQSEENDNLLMMMKDQYANYVVQKILDKCSDKQRETLISRIRVHCDSLKKYTYGKHIVARFEQLYGEESQPWETSCA